MNQFYGNPEVPFEIEFEEDNDSDVVFAELSKRLHPQEADTLRLTYE